MKKIIILSTILCLFTTNNTFSMLLKKITVKRNSYPIRACNTKAHFNYDEIILQTQKQNNDLKKRILFLETEMMLLRTTISEQSDGLTDRQRTKAFMSTDRDCITYPEQHKE